MAEYQRMHYHQPSDDLTLAFDWEAGANLAEINYAILREIADADQRPYWLEGNPVGAEFSADLPRASAQ